MRRFVFNDARVTKFVSESVGSTDCQAHSSFGVEADGQIVAGVVFDNFTGKNVFMHFSRAPGHMIDRPFLKLIFSWAFEHLQVTRITGAVSSANETALRFAVKLGFTYETKLEGAMPDGDLVFCVLRRSQCKHLIDWTKAEADKRAAVGQALTGTLRYDASRNVAVGRHD